MKFTDHLLQRWRIAKARPLIAPGSRVLDIGSADGALFQELGAAVGDGLGIDPTLKADTEVAGRRLIAGFFPKDMPPVEPFDVITMLAVLEHFPPAAFSSSWFAMDAAPSSLNCITASGSFKIGGIVIIRLSGYARSRSLWLPRSFSLQNESAARIGV